MGRFPKLTSDVESNLSHLNENMMEEVGGIKTTITEMN